MLFRVLVIPTHKMKKRGKQILKQLTMPIYNYL